MTTVSVRAVGLVTGWGRGVAALPAGPRPTTGGRGVLTATPSRVATDRLRRATRECLLAVDAVDALLEDGGLTRADVAGAATALVYVTAAAYGASNRAFIEGGGRALHFPYTAPSAVPAEVAIEFGLHGPYAVLIGGPSATVDALAHAAALLTRGACERAIVLAVETFAECEDLYARARWLVERPLVEAAAAALLEPVSPRSGAPGDAATAAVGGEPTGPRSRAPRDAATAAVGGEPTDPRSGATRDAATAEVGGGFGGSVSCPPNPMSAAPLIDLALARASGLSRLTVRGRWRGREASLTLGVTARATA